MNKIYVILPILCMIGFAFYFQDFHKEYLKIEETRKANDAKKLAEEEAFKTAEASRAAKAAEDAAAAKKAQAEADKKKKDDEQIAIDRAVDADIERANTEIALVKKELADAQKKLTETRAAREKAETVGFALAREVELTRIARRNNELELQRATEMLADRIGASTLVQEPLFPTPLAPPSK